MLPVFLIVLPVFCVLFPLIWIGVCLLLSNISGWRRLANIYRDERVRGETRTLTFHSAYIGIVRYKNCLKYELYDEGVRLSTWPIFRVGHLPLFIPWSEFHDVVERKRGYTAAKIGSPPICQVVLQLSSSVFNTRDSFEPPVVV